jgi:shikimate kinase
MLYQLSYQVKFNYFEAANIKCLIYITMLLIKELMNIILLGYMGVGKSLIGKQLSDLLNQNFIDLDAYIEKKEGKSIRNIFSDSGDIYFRKVESKLLKDCLSNNKNIILSVGGGTPCYHNNISLINSSKNFSIYLKNSNIELSKRLFKIKNNRPLISNIESEDKMIEFVSKHLFEREFYYNQASIKINCEGKDLNAICSLIISSLS